MNRRTQKSLSEVLIDNELITPDQWIHVQALVRAGRSVRQSLLELNLLTAEQLAMAMAEQADVLRIDLSNHIIEKKVIETVSEATVRKYKIIPVLKIANVLTCAVVDVFDYGALDAVAQETQLTVEPAIATEKEVSKAIDQYYPKDEFMHSMESVLGQTSEGSDATSTPGFKKKSSVENKQLLPVMDFIYDLIVQGVRQKVSDIHIKPEHKSFTIRFRMDGVLYEQAIPDKEVQTHLVSHIKMMSDLDVDEHLRPQEGRFQVTVDERKVEVQVSLAPTLDSENIVISLGDSSFSSIGLYELGFDNDLLPEFQKQLKNTSGLILFSGPKRSGKTTTVYASLKNLNGPEKSIVTIEDPVECQISGVCQMQVNPEVGLTFVKGLRTALRQDPDVIMVGEIHDLETATLAIQAALTGHLVVATLQAHDAPNAATRLIDMGIEPYLMSSALNCVVAQRLVRLLCSDCKGKGCGQCSQRGYKRRQAIYELMPNDSDIQKLIKQKSSSDEIRRFATASGMTSLRDNGLKKYEQGLTSKEEVLRVTPIV